MPPVHPLSHPRQGFVGRPLKGPRSLTTTPMLAGTHKAFYDLSTPHLWPLLILLQSPRPRCSSSTPTMSLPQGLCTCCSCCLECSSSCYLHVWLPHFLLGLSSIVTFSMTPFLTTLCRIPAPNLTIPFSPPKRYFLPSHVLLTCCFTCSLSPPIPPKPRFTHSISPGWPRLFVAECAVPRTVPGTQ